MDDMALTDFDDEIQPLINHHLSDLDRAIQLIQKVSLRMLEVLAEDITGHNVLLGIGARIHNHLLAGLVLFREGLLTDALVCDRSATESIFLFQFLIQDKSRMEKWLTGRKFSPSEVRKASVGSELMKNIYGHQSKITHPNLAALGTYALIDDSSISVSFGPRLPHIRTIATFFSLLQSATMFLRIVTTLLQATGENELSNLSEQALQSFDHVLDELEVKLSTPSADS
jgi:hypothetical protein